MSIKRFKTDLERARIRKIDITKIMDGLKLLQSKGISERDMEIVVRNIIDDRDYRTKFMRDPLSVTGGFAPPYVPVTPK